MKLDLKDKKILYQLDLNSRQSNSQIAKKVGLSKEVVNYRIKNLEKKNYIQQYYTVIDFSKLGYFSIRVYLKLFDTDPKKEAEIFSYLTNNKKTFFVSEIDGPFDIGFAVWVKTIYEFEDFYLKFKKKFKKFIGKEQISIFTSVHHFHRVYLLDKEFDDTKPWIYGKSNLVKHDKLDLKILQLLAENSRIQTIEISKQLKTPPRTIAFRIKQLEKKGIIQGYRFNLNFDLIDYKYYKVDLTLKDISRLNELISYARSNPNIIYIDETIAGSDFEFDMEVKNKKEFSKIMQDLKIKFPEIRTWSYFTATKYLKLLYFPEI